MTQDDAPREDLEDLYEHAPCGYLSVRPDGRLFKVNATFSSWSGFSAEQLLGMRLAELLNIAGRIYYQTHLSPILRLQGFVNEVALDFVTNAKGPLHSLVNATEIRDGEGNHRFTRLTVFNATERRRYERDLVQARKAAETAQQQLATLNAAMGERLLDEQATSALREQFIAVLGHDLRNPLAAIDGGMQLLARTPLNDRATKVLGMVRGSVVRMADLIDNVMDFARGRLGSGLTLERNANEPLGPVLWQVVSELETSSADRDIVAEIEIDTDVDCDRRRIGQLLSNLLGNAVTYGALDKPIRVHASTRDAVFELYVANGGEPIPAEALEKLFEPFTRGAVRPSREGLGLGLYISHSIALAHGGTLTVSSGQDETRFTFRMPLSAGLLRGE